ncbi:MAG: DUF2807 domain-containing protein [Cyclobacteriaceae bacterium]
MNISTKILMGFFGSAFVYMSAVFIEIRLTGEDVDIHGEDAKVESVPIDNIKYVIIADLGQRIYLKSSDKPGLEFRSASGDLASRLVYEINGDTLNLRELNLEENTKLDITLLVPQELVGIEVNEAAVYLSDLKQPRLSIIQTGGRTVFNQGVKIGKLDITATESAEFDAFGGDIDTVALDLDNSDVELRTNVGRLEGSMKNRSYLYIEDINDISFKKDENSHLKL